MTQADKWAKRPPVLRYFAFREEVRLNKIKIPEYGAHVIFVMPMPNSWSQKKKDSLRGQAHQQKPDVDNLCKSLLDSIFDNDCAVWDIRTTKIWGDKGEIRIRSEEEDDDEKEE